MTRPATRYALRHGWARDEHRYELAPLLAHAGGINKLSEKIGVSGSDITRANTDGLTELQADNWAIRLGLHPALLWPTWIEDGLAVVDRPLLDEVA